MKLIYSDTRREVKTGDRTTIHYADGDREVEVVQIQVPHKPSSTGRVIVCAPGKASDWRGWISYFPGVIGAEWIEREDQT